MPNGLWRGVVASTQTSSVAIEIPRLGGLWIAEPLPEIELIQGDGVLCAFREDLPDVLEIIRKTRDPVPTDTYTSTYGGSY